MIGLVDLPGLGQECDALPLLFFSLRPRFTGTIQRGALMGTLTECPRYVQCNPLIFVAAVTSDIFLETQVMLG